ncbi:hypothetical protein K440DRAFT_640212 [Wilcoxina mikolae CBS 423.85]|nr:hypothetical protein K440DRAFT_640212 [Wilcoxina mikolae CBS 423.85]
MSSEISLSVNDRMFEAGWTFKLGFGLDLPNIDIFGTNIGSFSGTMVEFSAGMNIKMMYILTQFQLDGFEYTVRIELDVLGVNISATLKLDVSVRDLEDLPGIVKAFVEDQVVDGLKRKFLEPLRKIEELTEKGFNETRQAFNIGAFEMAHAMMGAGYEVGEITNVMKDGFDLSIHEPTALLLDCGHEITDVANAVGNTFEAFPGEIATTFTAMGSSIEHAFIDGANVIARPFADAGNAVADFLGMPLTRLRMS